MNCEHCRLVNLRKLTFDKPYCSACVKAEKEKNAVIQSVIFGYGFRARSGKDTVAAMILADRSNTYNIKVYSFAGELKKEVNENAMKSGGMIRLFDEGLRDPMGGFMQENGNFLPLPEWVQYDPNPDMSDPLCPYGKQRLFLQWYGQEFRRACNPQYWINKVAAKIAEDKPEIALVSDLRYPNEVSFIRKYGEIIKVNRPGLPPLQGAAGVHASELALANFNDWDDVIENNGTLEQLREKALFSFDMLLSSHPLARPTSA